MKEIVLEVVLEYRPEELRKWRGGRRIRAAESRVPATSAHPPACQFAEHFTLSLYRKAGWSGHRFYGLDEQAPRDARAAAGHIDVRRCFSAVQLQALARERGISAADPSLFLFRSSGDALFLEVTKGRERVPPERLQGLAQIRRVLGADVGVVYVKPHGPWYEPRQWELDLAAGSGRLLPRERESSSASLAGLWNVAGQ